MALATSFLSYFIHQNDSSSEHAPTVTAALYVASFVFLLFHLPTSFDHRVLSEAINTARMPRKERSNEINYRDWCVCRDKNTCVYRFSCIAPTLFRAVSFRRIARTMPVKFQLPSNTGCYTNNDSSYFLPAMWTCVIRAHVHTACVYVRTAMCNPFTGSFGTDRFTREAAVTISMFDTVLTSCLHFNQKPPPVVVIPLRNELCYPAPGNRGGRG